MRSLKILIENGSSKLMLKVDSMNSWELLRDLFNLFWESGTLNTKQIVQWNLKYLLNDN